MEAKANNKSLIWLVVINNKKEAVDDATMATFEGFQTLLLNYSEFRFVFTIVHNRDALKRMHLHVVIELYEKATKKAVLATLCELLNIEPEQVSLDASNSPILGVQYLTHKNQPEKEPYSFDEIKTNNKEELERRYGLAYENPEQERKRVLFGSKTMTELLEKLSIEEAKKVLPVWKAIQEEQGYDKAGLIDQLNKMRADYTRLYDLTNEIFETLQFKAMKGRESDFKLYFGRLLAIFETFLPF